MAKTKEKEAPKEKDAEDEKKDKETEDTPEGEEGEAGAEGGEAGKETGKKSRKKIIIIGALSLLVVIGGSAGVYFSGVLNKHEVKDAVILGPDGKPIEKPIFYTLPEFLVNLNSGGKQQSVFLKTTVLMEVAHQTDVPIIEANLPRLVDALNTYLRELRPSDLAGSAGIQRLREELLLRANKTLAPVKINDVLFKEIIVQ